MKMNEIHESCCREFENTLYKIGMFAAMNHVTVKALRFYEEQGLLLPAHIDRETGYRHYTLNQMADLHQIIALKEAGFSLEEIRELRAGGDSESDLAERRESLLARKRAELLAKIAELTRQVAVLEGYLAGKSADLAAPVLVKTLPACTVAYMDTVLDSYDCLFEKMPEMGALMEAAGCECALPEYCFTSYLDGEYKEENIKAEICEAVTAVPVGADGIVAAGGQTAGSAVDAGRLKFKQLPETQAACIFHKGSYRELGRSYEAVLRHIEEKGYRIAGPIRESYIDGVWNCEDESQWLTEIQVPVL